MQYYSSNLGKEKIWGDVGKDGQTNICKFLKMEQDELLKRGIRSLVQPVCIFVHLIELCYASSFYYLRLACYIISNSTSSAVQQQYLSAHFHLISPLGSMDHCLQFTVISFLIKSFVHHIVFICLSLLSTSTNLCHCLSVFSP